MGAYDEHVDCAYCEAGIAEEHNPEPCDLVLLDEDGIVAELIEAWEALADRAESPEVLDAALRRIAAAFQ